MKESAQYLEKMKNLKYSIVSQPITLKHNVSITSEKRVKLLKEKLGEEGVEKGSLI